LFSAYAGLGLASAYGIIENHGGFITVDSTIGKGSTFFLHLPASSIPLTTADKNYHKTDDISGNILRGTEKILFVDDEPMIIEVGTLILTEIGYDVLTAFGGEEAIRIYEEKWAEISLVIIDLIMPGMDGGATFDRIKEINPKAIVLLSSGYSMDGQAEKVMRRGCNGFIQKPYRMQNLSMKIRELISLS
jgi:two-component system, cell cycle sensor histidine kinase and response regulator CckA